MDHRDLLPSYEMKILMMMMMMMIIPDTRYKNTTEKKINYC
jgi:hypothetical protein